MENNKFRRHGASVRATSTCEYPRRVSVAPTSASLKFRRGTDNSISTNGLPIKQEESLENVNSSDSFSSINMAANKLRRMSNFFNVEKIKPKEALRTAFSNPLKDEYFELSCRNDNFSAELKRIKGYLQQLNADYEAGRNMDPVRRYKELQAMIKRTILHMKIIGDAEIEGSSVLQSEAKMKEMRQHKEEFSKNFSSEDYQREISRLSQENKQMENQIDFLIDKITSMETKYQDSKNEIFLRRYAILKESVKEVILSQAQFNDR